MGRGTRRYLLMGILFLATLELSATPPELTGEWNLVSKYFFVDPLHKNDSVQFILNSLFDFVSETSVEIYSPQFDSETGITINRKKKYTCEYETYQKFNEDRLRVDDQEYLIIQINTDKFLLIPIEGDALTLKELGTPQYLVRGPEVPKVFGVY